MWDDTPSRGAGLCAGCGHVVDDGPVRWIPRMTGPDIRIVIHDPGRCPTVPDTRPPGRPPGLD
ncbi:hypothetical protein [Streptomyces microflavus]|uniref:hypothetical protein n=1 Tax=Streptomyces microflavus TaxID=1919 RepID=UPI0033E122F1